MTSSSIPAGAIIYFDGNYGDVSPQVIGDIPTGTNTRSLKQDEYYDRNSEIKFVTGIPVTIKAKIKAHEIPYGSSITIQSSPSNTDVYVYEQLNGYTPQIPSDSDPGDYHINLKLAGYQDWIVSAEEQGKNYFT